jgi:imidazolonepropionase-like amidohydrolase
VAGGVTCVASGPGSTNTIGGQFLVIKTYGDAVDEMVVKAPLAMKCAFGENIKRAYGDKGRTPMTRMGNAAVLRETLMKAFDYEAKIKAAGDDPSKRPPTDFKMEAMLPVVRGQMPLKAHAHRADDIMTAIRIAKEFKVELTLEHCTEGHLIARHIAKAGVPAITGPSFGFQGKMEVMNKSLSTPKVLHEHGVLTAIMTDHPVIPIERLVFMAGLVMQEGLSFQETLDMVTINPAKILGIDDRVGSLEVGKDADIVIWSGNPLEMMAKPLMTIIDGQVVYRQ